MPATASLPQTLTPYHAKYYAYELTRRCPPDSDDRVASALVDAQVDLNPHQIDAALFSGHATASLPRWSSSKQLKRHGQLLPVLMGLVTDATVTWHDRCRQEYSGLRGSTLVTQFALNA